MISVRFEGGEQLARNLAQLSERASKKMLRDALREGAVPMRAAIASAAPREGGAPDIADNIVIGTSRARPGDAAAISVGPSKKPRSDQPGRTFDVQGYLLEFGTLYRAATPFMSSAMRQISAALGIIKGSIWRGLVQRGFSTRGSGGGGGLT